MVFLNQITIKYIILVGVLFLVTGSCIEEDEDLGSVDCSNCMAGSDFVDLEITLTINDTYSEVPLILYNDVLADRNATDTFYVYNSPTYIAVEPNRKYAIAAVYRTPEKSIRAVDGTKIKFTDYSSDCGDDCFILSGERLDVSLKYD